MAASPALEKSTPSQSRPGPRGSARLGHQRRDRDEPHGGHRHIEQEDPAPPVVGEQPAAQDRTNGKGQEVGGRPDTHRPGPLLLREQDGDRRDGHDDDPRAGETEQKASHQERRSRRHGGTQGRARTKQGERDEQDLLAPVPIAQQARRQHGRGENERIPGREPLQVGLRRPQRDGQRGQRHAQDGHIDTDREHCESDCRKRPPAARTRSLHSSHPLSLVTIDL